MNLADAIGRLRDVLRRQHKAIATEASYFWQPDEEIAWWGHRAYKIPDFLCNFVGRVPSAKPRFGRGVLSCISSACQETEHAAPMGLENRFGFDTTNFSRQRRWRQVPAQKHRLCGPRQAVMPDATVTEIASAPIQIQNSPATKHWTSPSTVL
jgi:hypothetical protein